MNTKLIFGGLSYNDIPFIFSKSERGTFIQFKENLDWECVELILDKLLLLLNSEEKK